MNARDGFDRVFAALPASRSYREAMRTSTPELPDWLIPFNGIGGDELARIADEARVGSGGSFVDLACGTGGAGLWIAERTGAALVGVDFSAAAIECAVALAQQRGHAGRARFVVADAEETGLRDGDFDAVVCIDALIFMNVERAADEMGEAASSLIEEARDGIAREGQPPRVRKVFIVAQRR